MKKWLKYLVFTGIAGVVIYVCFDLYIYFLFRNTAPKQALTYAVESFASIPDDSIPDNIIQAYDSVYPTERAAIYPDLLWIVTSKLKGKHYVQEKLAYDISTTSKFELMSLANQLDNELSHKQCVYAYMSRFDFLNEASGIQSAADIYYGKTIEELNATECLELVIMLENPSMYNKYTHQERIDKKVREVRSKMQD